MDTSITSKDMGAKFEITFVARVYEQDREDLASAVARAAAALVSAMSTDPKPVQTYLTGGETAEPLVNWKERYEAERTTSSGLRDRVSHWLGEHGKVSGELAIATKELGEALEALTAKSCEVEELRMQIQTMRNPQFVPCGGGGGAGPTMGGAG